MPINDECGATKVTIQKMNCTVYKINSNIQKRRTERIKKKEELKVYPKKDRQLREHKQLKTNHHDINTIKRQQQ